MGTYHKKTALVIDGPDVYATCRALGVDIDYKALRQHYEETCDLRMAFYYAALHDIEKYPPLRPLTDWLSYNGYTVVTKPAREYQDETGKRRVKGDMDVEIAVDMVELAPFVDNVVLFSGDADFRRLVEALQRQGVRVTVVCTITTIPPMVSDELRRQADRFVDLADIVKHFARAETRLRPARQIQGERIRSFAPG